MSKIMRVEFGNNKNRECKNNGNPETERNRNTEIEILDSSWLQEVDREFYLHHKEYGSARWGTKKDIEPYMDEKFQNNILLTQTVFEDHPEENPETFFLHEPHKYPSESLSLVSIPALSPHSSHVFVLNSPMPASLAHRFFLLMMLRPSASRSGREGRA